MEIIKKRAQLVLFGDLQIGDVFESPLGVCMKLRDVDYSLTRTSTGSANGVRLETGDLVYIGLDAEVRPVKAELHVL